MAGRGGSSPSPSSLSSWWPQKQTSKSYGRLYISTNHEAPSTILHDEEDEEKNGRSEAAAGLLAVAASCLGVRRLQSLSVLSRRRPIETDGDAFDLFGKCLCGRVCGQKESIVSSCLIKSLHQCIC